MALPALRRSRLGASVCVAVFLVAWPLGVTAQPAGQSGPTPATAPADGPRRDYMFGRPRGSFAVRGSWLFATAGSDLYDFVTEQLTLDKGAFDAPSIAVELDVSLSPRLDVVVGIETSHTSEASEYRDYVDNNELPITQETSLREFGVFGSVKYALTPRGRQVSRFAWIPRTVTPYVGAGGGVVKYDFKQTGDFIDFADLSVFSDTFQSEGWAPSVHAFGGVDVRVYRILYVTAEGRYTWSSAELESDFVGFEPIDLSGFRFGAGVRLVF